VGNHVYYYAIHVDLVEGPDGRVVKKLRKCYLGPDLYTYVTKTHSDIRLALKGAIEDGRQFTYIKDILRTLKEDLEADRVSPEQYPRLSSNLNEIKGMVEDLMKAVADKEIEHLLERQRAEGPTKAS
jgi:hypothetical protein